MESKPSTHCWVFSSRGQRGALRHLFGGRPCWTPPGSIFRGTPPFTLAAVAGVNRAAMPCFGVVPRRRLRSPWVVLFSSLSRGRPWAVGLAVAEDRHHQGQQPPGDGRDRLLLAGTPRQPLEGKPPSLVVTHELPGRFDELPTAAAVSPSSRSPTPSACPRSPASRAPGPRRRRPSWSSRSVARRPARPAPPRWSPHPRPGSCGAAAGLLARPRPPRRRSPGVGRWLLAGDLAGTRVGP